MSRENTVVRLSVRAVVEFSIHESDLSPAAKQAQRMREGAAGHKARQSTQSELSADFRAEAALAADYEAEGFTLHVTGRADGLTSDESGMRVIEEYKLGEPDSPLHPAHMAQAAMYGHMLCEKEDLERVLLRVLYISSEGKVLQTYDALRDRASLAEEFSALCAAAAAWEAVKLERKARRDETLKNLAFPYDAYRPGQRKFAQNVYVAIRERRRLFAQAPTGIGKTIAALFPALRALGDGLCGRVLFLAARTTGRRSAMEALSRLHAAGARAMCVELCAKDKVCMLDTRDCRPEVCPYAKGFYDRLPDALAEALNTDFWNREAIAALAQTYTVCPFELSLEMAKLADAVICDFNYVFDPMVAVDALMQGAGGTSLLVDEAHQLAPRVRDTLSATLDSEALRQLRRDTGKDIGRKSPLYLALTEAIRAMEALPGLPEFESGRLSKPPEAIAEAMRAVRDASAEQLSAYAVRTAADAFSLAACYLFASERLNERYAVLCAGTGKHVSLELACLNAADEIAERTKRSRGTVYFSATLAPFPAAKLALGTSEGDACLRLPSPFDPAHLRVQVLPLDIRYAARERTAPQLAEAVAAHITAHPGNTLVFFPSYSYMNRVWELLMGMDAMQGRELLREKRGMTEEEKNALLSALDTEQGVCVFAVLGGAFSEGIDLPGKRLQSVIVVSTGMPQPDARLRAMQDYWNAQGEDGFFLTMTLPGMIRVIQAAGRLIRTDTDEGDLLLIDSRYRTRHILELLSGTLIGEALDRV